MRTGPKYGRWGMIAITVVGAGCYNRHVNGTTVPPDRTCELNWTAVVTNTTDRIYDLYVGTRLVGTADARSTSRTIIRPEFGLVTPSIRESALTRDRTGPRMLPGALRMVCE